MAACTSRCPGCGFPDDRAEELVRAFRARVGLVDDADGFVDLQVWQSDRDRGELVMVSRWRDRRAFTALSSLCRWPPRSPTATSRATPRTSSAPGADVARAWEMHDTQHLLNWAIGDVEGFIALEERVTWLADVLAARDFPLEHLADKPRPRRRRGRGARRPTVAERLRAAADHVRAR